ncbi:MAG: NfeD family protein [Moraxella sp.]|nr:NfeD family protein [Moraxella sp.]
MLQLEPWHWLVFGIVLMTAEMFVPTFFLLWFGAAAVVVALLSWVVGLPFAVAVGIWLVLSVLFCGLWFKFIQPKMKNRTKAGLGGSVIIGELGMIVKAPTDGNMGMIRFSVPKVGATEWVCRSDDALQMGDRAVVLQILGNELIVAKK